MSNDWLSHKELKIIRGVYAAPGDSNSVEPAIVTLNLMSNNTGIALKSDGWSPNIPSLKDSGVWADSPISDGRRLISGVNSNVIESMQLTITGATFQDVTAWLSALRNMMQDARDFWQANAQIDPVYLKWWASCGAGPQYALIYNMDMKPTYVQSPTPTLDVTLTIERETFWRAIPPGANPKQWTYEALGQPYDSTKAVLGNSSPVDTVLSGTLVNISEYSSSTFVALRTINFITIPATSVPGDAPALMNFYFKQQVSTNYNILVGKKTRKITQIGSAGAIAQNATICLNDGTLGINATAVNDTGAVRSNSSATFQRVEVSFATATNQLRWNLARAEFSINKYIGRWQIFLRCRQQGGTLGDITMYMRYGIHVAGDTDGVKLNVVSPPVIAGAGNTTEWGLVYMGVINVPALPTKADVNQNILGGGQATGLNNLAVGDFQLGLFALRSAGAAPLYMCDIIMIPVDEGSMALEIADTPGDSNGVWYDETGYITHGASDQVAVNGLLSSSFLASMKLSGLGIQLTPNVENRLYYVIYDDTNQSSCADTASFHINIVPRWTGIRGV